MAICRVEKNKDYTAMSNYHLRDTRLSLKAVGLLSKILSLPEEWDYTISGLAHICKEGKDAVRAAVVELEKAGYIQRRQLHDSRGVFSGNEYVIFEAPQPPLSENPSTDAPSTDAPLTENPTELNKDIINNLPITPLKSPQGGRRAKRTLRKAPDWKPERFAGFWSYYPRGENKQRAMDAWDKLRPDDDLIDTIAKALLVLKASEDWQRGIGIPHAATFLNNARWEDADKLLPSGTGPQTAAGWADDPEVMP